jgi:hypothetical protein
MSDGTLSVPLAGDVAVAEPAETGLVLSETKLFRMKVDQTDNPDHPRLSIGFLPPIGGEVRWIGIDYRQWREVAEQLEYMMRVLRKSARPTDAKTRK